MKLLLPSGGVSEICRRLMRLHWPLVILLTVIACTGVMTLYSVASGSWYPWAMRHALRFLAALCMMIAAGLVPVRYWMSAAYPVYCCALLALFLVPVTGEIHMGARRWIEVAGFQFQPSELMKTGLVLGLARYYHDLRMDQVSRLPYLLIPAVMIAVPVALVFMQPDLGTSLLLVAAAVMTVFAAGIGWRIVLAGFACVFATGIAAYRFRILKPYQLERILTFLHPERDPLGQGYHLQQSKIALGSGGLSGKGYMEGSQSQLQFLPEMQTDFIFTIFGEEFGFIGAVLLLLVYAGVIWAGISVALRCKMHFARLAVTGIVSTFALYVLINTGMVMGLAPVVGVPLPLVSYGGTSMLTVMAGFGIVMSAHLCRDRDTGRTPEW